MHEAIENQQPPGVHYEICRVKILVRLAPCVFISHLNTPGDTPEKSQRQSVSFMTLLATAVVDGYHMNQNLLLVDSELILCH